MGVLCGPFFDFRRRCRADGAGPDGEGWEKDHIMGLALIHSLLYKNKKGTYIMDHANRFSSEAPDGDGRVVSAIPGPAPVLGEVNGAAGDGAATGFILSQLAAGTERPVLLWVQDRLSLLEGGRPFPAGIGQAAPGLSLLHVAAGQPRDVLWAMEEGLKCAAIAAVIGEIHGSPKALDFTATKRLAFLAERNAVPAFLLRAGGVADLSSARRRWRVESSPSAPHRWDGRAPGLPGWRIDLFRARGTRPGLWEVVHDPAAPMGTADRFRLVPAPDNGKLADTRGEWRRAG